MKFYPRMPGKPPLSFAALPRARCPGSAPRAYCPSPKRTICTWTNSSSTAGKTEWTAKSAYPVPRIPRSYSGLRHLLAERPLPLLQSAGTCTHTTMIELFCRMGIEPGWMNSHECRGRPHAHQLTLGSVRKLKLAKTMAHRFPGAGPMVAHFRFCRRNAARGLCHWFAAGRIFTSAVLEAMAPRSRVEEGLHQGACALKAACRWHFFSLIRYRHRYLKIY